MSAPKKSRRDATSVDGRVDRTGLVAIAAAVLAVVCCAAGPAILAVLGTVAVGSALGWAAGALALLVGIAVLVVIVRRRQDGVGSVSSREVGR